MTYRDRFFAVRVYVSSLLVLCERLEYKETLQLKPKSRQVSDIAVEQLLEKIARSPLAVSFDRLRFYGDPSTKRNACSTNL